MRISRTLLRVVKKSFEQHLQEKHVKYFEKFLEEILLHYLEIEISTTRKNLKTSYIERKLERYNFV